MSITHHDNQQDDRAAGAIVCNSINPQDLLTATPERWYTVASWWALEERGVLEMLPDPLATFREDDAQLQKRCAANGWPVVWVPACAALKAEGFQQERAYPERLLAEFYPVNG